MFKDATHHMNSAQSDGFFELKDTILPDNPVRFICAFANSIDLEKIEFILDY